MSIVVKIGQNTIMKEPCTIFSMGTAQQYLFQALRNQNPYQNSNPYPNPMPSQSNNVPISQSNQLQIRPKWQSNGQINTDSYKTLSSKIEVLNKILNSFFVEETKDDSESKILNRLIEEVAMQKNSDMNDKQEDFDSFQKLISFLSSVDFKDYSTFANMTREQYASMNPSTKAYLIQEIKQNKIELIANLNLNMDNHPSSTSSLMNKTFSSNSDTYSGEYNKFRTMINVPNVPDEHCKYYLNQELNDLNKAVEKYFQNTYTTNVLSLKFIYENGKESIHYFNFTAKPIEFHEKVRCDFPSMMSFKFYTMDNQEVNTISSKIKCVGGFHFANGTPIKVKEIK